MSEHHGNLAGETDQMRNDVVITVVSHLHRMPQDGNHAAFHRRSVEVLHETQRIIDNEAAQIANETARRLLDDKN